MSELERIALREISVERDALKAELALQKETCRAGFLARDHYKSIAEKMAATLAFLRDYTYLDAESPELRAQNERCHRMAKEALQAYRADGERE